MLKWTFPERSLTSLFLVPRIVEIAIEICLVLLKNSVTVSEEHKNIQNVHIIQDFHTLLNTQAPGIPGSDKLIKKH